MMKIIKFYNILFLRHENKQTLYKLSIQKIIKVPLKTEINLILLKALENVLN